MAPTRKNPPKKKSTKTSKRTSNRCNDCSSTSSSSSSSESSTDYSDSSSETDSCTDCCDCSDSDCSDCWECDLPARKRGGKKSRGKVFTAKPSRKGKKKSSSRRSKHSFHCTGSSCESSDDDCSECVPKKPGKKARA